MEKVSSWEISYMYTSQNALLEFKAVLTLELQLVLKFCEKVGIAPNPSLLEQGIYSHWTIQASIDVIRLVF